MNDARTTRERHTNDTRTIHLITFGTFDDPVGKNGDLLETFGKHRETFHDILETFDDLLETFDDLSDTFDDLSETFNDLCWKHLVTFDVTFDYLLETFDDPVGNIW